MEWQPIETVPKKCITVDDWSRDNVVHFSISSQKVLLTDGKIVWEDGYELTYDTDELSVGWLNWGSVEWADKPTHWMPLPEPPKP